MSTETDAPLMLPSAETETDQPLYLASNETETERPLYLADVDEDRKVLHMVTGDYEDEVVIDDDDVVFGRMPVGGAGDPSEFDYVPPRFADFTTEDSALITGDDAVPSMFESPEDTQDAFPLLRAALRHYTEASQPKRVVRIDTDDTFDDFVSDKTVAEISRRLDALEQKVNEHESDPYAHPHTHRGRRMFAEAREDVLGAAQAVADLQDAKTARQAVDAMPQVPVDVPEDCQPHVRCWRDGDWVVVSLRFAGVDGQPRFATAAARPATDADDVARWALKSGVEPSVVLGALPELSAVACGKRLVRDVAGAALRAKHHHDVLGATGPVLLTSKGTQASTPLAAIMWVQQLADGGHPQAQLEMAKLHRAAMTPTGQQVAAPLLSEARRRIEAGRAQQPKTLWQRIKGFLQ